MLAAGLLVFDDSTLDHLYVRQIELVVRHWSGKHHAVVRRINLMTLLWTDGDRHVPCDYRIFDKQPGGLTKNDHFQALLRDAHKRGFRPCCVAFDGWYASLPNLKLLRSYDWTWLTRLKKNRSVNPDGTGVVALSQVELDETGRSLHLTGYGLIRVFRLVSREGDTEYWATNGLQMTDLTRVKWASYA